MTEPASHRSDEKLSPAEIAANFEDLHPPLTPLQAMAAANRCLYCYDAPCIQACPTAIDIPTFIRKIATGNVTGAAKTILSSNILGGTCARACPTEVLCEQACVRNVAEDHPVEIGHLQRHAVDHLMAEGGTHPFERAAPSGKTVAVVGAGPAGLSCAHRAARLGHAVTIFEARPKPGGLNEYGLAAYKMTDDFAQKEVAFLLGIGGITIEHGRRLGDNLHLADLTGDFDAVFLGLGLGGSRALDLPGEDLAGVGDALDFIETLRQADDKSRVAIGEEVVVIGGGNTAIDAAVQAKLLGAEQVTLVYRRGPDQMGATGWEQELAKVSGVTIRHWAAPTAINGDGAVTSVTFERTRLVEGRLTGTGRHLEIPADTVLKAVGQTLIDTALAGVTVRRGKIEVDAHYRTSLPKVYAGGDCIASGEDLTVQAVEDGKRAAEAIDAALLARAAV